MKSRKYSFILILPLLIFFGSGCAGTYNTTQKSELRRLHGKGPLRILTLDTLLYTFTTFTFTDSNITGLGTVKQNNLTTPFEGSIPFAHILFIERIEPSFLKFVWFIPMLSQALGSISLMLAGHTEFDIHRVTSGSCPYVYSHNGKEFILDAEAFGTSISKAFESQTFSILPSLIPQDHLLTIRIRNERPETHLVNNVQLLVADKGHASSAVLDVDNALWPVTHTLPPTKACDHSGRDIIADIRENDGRYWESDLAHSGISSGFRDNIELRFDFTRQTSDALLIVHAVNSNLITEAYRSAGDMLGDATMEFYHTLEHNIQWQNEIKQWKNECSLRIEIADGERWEEIGTLPPEATVTPFTRAIRIPGIKNHQLPLRLRLSSLTDVWRIDAVSIECSPAQPLTLQSLNLISLTSTDKYDWVPAISANDSLYALILPPNSLDIQFDAAPTLSMHKPVYLVAVQGYFYEWFPQPEEIAGKSLLSKLAGRERIAMLRLLVQQKDLFLSPIYSRWRSVTRGGIRK